MAVNIDKWDVGNLLSIAVAIILLILDKKMPEINFANHCCTGKFSGESVNCSRINRN